jgi:pyruvate/2-oxoglutarate/acetoin dehydrogenase E1 component
MSNSIASKKVTFVEAINDALHIAMSVDPDMITYGLGINDPKRIFGTTSGLCEAFGNKRVFDMPTSENAMTGVSIGAALGEVRSVVTHQRLDFFLLAMDQLVNSAAKWNYTYGISVPITIRLIIGRGWGQGPTHSQNLQAWFGHIPGLKVVMPTTPYDAKGLLLGSIFDPNPVVFLEHRWLHNAVGDVPEGDFRLEIGKAKKITDGKDITIVSMSYLTVEARKAVTLLRKANVNCELIDLISIKPIDWELIKSSVKKTGNLLVLDTGHETGSIAGEIIAKIAIECFQHLKASPMRLAMPDIPEPSSFGLTKDLFIRYDKIVKEVLKMIGGGADHEIIKDLTAVVETVPHDVPGDWFKGPF